MGVLEFLDGRAAGDGRWEVSTPPSLDGAYGGTFGGVLAALVVGCARECAPGRLPFSLDCQFVRGLRGDRAEAVAEVVRAGRTLTVVAVQLLDGGEAVTRGTVLLVEPSSVDAGLHELDDRGAPSADRHADRGAGEAWSQPADRRIGLIDTFVPRARPLDDGAVATTLTVPWDDPDAAAEAACLAADIATGPSVGALVARTGAWRGHPNPDLSVRFLPGRLPVPEVVGVGRLDGAAAGVAVTRIDVFGGGRRLASGVSTSLVSPPPA